MRESVSLLLLLYKVLALSQKHTDCCSTVQHQLPLIKLQKSYEYRIIRVILASVPYDLKEEEKKEGKQNKATLGNT
eukprot:scaffold6333_cov189-Chaetoceros_neogracile.AAC.2